MTNWHNSSGDGRKKQIKHFWAQHFLSVSLSIWIWALDITICGRLQLFKPAIFFSTCWWHSDAWQRLANWWLTNWHNSTGDGQKIEIKHFWVQLSLAVILDLNLNSWSNNAWLRLLGLPYFFLSFDDIMMLGRGPANQWLTSGHNSSGDERKIKIIKF